MRRGGVLHPQLAHVLATLGHHDLLVVADAGLPVPRGVERIHLAVVPGVPDVVTVLRALAAELVVERLVVADQVGAGSPHVLTAVREFWSGVPQEQVPHAELLDLLPSARAVVRSGEFSPYANVVLDCGVPFA